jgi:hypothetical protein
MLFLVFQFLGNYFPKLIKKEKFLYDLYIKFPTFFLKITHFLIDILGYMGDTDKCSNSIPKFFFLSSPEWYRESDTHKKTQKEFPFAFFYIAMLFTALYRHELFLAKWRSLRSPVICV